MPYVIPVLALIAAILVAGIVVLGRRLRASDAEAERLTARYGGLIDVERERDTVRADLERLASEKAAAVAENEELKTSLSKRYAEALAKYDRLQKEIGLLEESLEMVEFGVYKPHYDYQTPDQYKAALEGLREKEKALIKADAAVSCKVARS